MSASINYNSHLPPQNIEAEQATLGAMLLQEEAISQIIEMLSEKDFYKEAHRKIFSAILFLFEKNEPADLITLTAYLRDKKMLEEIGGASYLTSLVDLVPSSLANIEHYARIVKEKALLRELINCGSCIISEAFNQEKEINEILDEAEKRIFFLSQQKISRDFVHIKDLLEKNYEEIENLYKKEVRITGLPTGFIDLDNLSSGLQNAELIILAGRPSMGKTAFALEIAQTVAIKNNFSVAIFSLEMSKEQVVRRMLCSEGRVNAHKLRTGKLSQEDFPKLSIALGKLAEAPIYIDDTASLTPLEIRAKARRLKSKQDLRLIIIDYLQLMQTEKRAENRQQEISDISRRLKALAKELNIPVIAISQLNRAPESRSGNRPQLADLRESGALEQDGDLIIFLFREEYYIKKPENKGKAEIIIAKQRNGPIGTVEIAFIEEYPRFEDLSYREYMKF